MAAAAAPFPSMQAVYADLGLHTGALGCVKLPMEPAPIAVDDVGGLDALYTSTSPLRPWVKGWINGAGAHTTLLYGLLPGVAEAHVHTALAGWSVAASAAAPIRDILVFPSPVPTEDPYVCLVAALTPSVELMAGHDKLRALPHICRFPEFKPHVTLAYIRADYYEAHPELLPALCAKLVGTPLRVLGDGATWVFAPAGTKI